jgi:N6-L-threonylcarbamoyladenine synthase
MIILGIETSCDETSAAIIKIENKRVEVLSNIISSSLSLHSKTGGIIPEIAAREQLKYIIPVISEATKVLKNPKEEIDQIAVTIGPGLIGSLLVGVETARTYSYVWNKPLIAVNHLYGHIYANFINKKIDEIKFPIVSLIVSGGHTDLVLLKKHGDVLWLGGTRDDAAGEALDKVGRLLNLSYPGGPQIEKMAANVKKDFYKFPKPLINSRNYDFSFSGLKTAVLKEVEKQKELNNEFVSKISFSLQEAIFNILVKKTLQAVNEFNANSILLGGGVAANAALKEKFVKELTKKNSKIKFFVPPKKLCTDNAAMIATAGFYNQNLVPWNKISADPELYFE